MMKYSVNNSAKYGYKERRKKESEMKSERVTVQISKREKKILTLLADRNGQTISQYIRTNCIHKPYNELTGGDF